MKGRTGVRKRLERGIKSVARTFLRLALRTQPAPPPDPVSVRSLLVIRQHNQLGDMLCAVPLLRALRLRYPGARIALMTSPANHEVMQENPYLDEIIDYDKREFLGGPSGIWRLWRYVRGLRKKNFDLAIVPVTVSMSLTSDLFAWLSGAQYRVGANSLDGKLNASSFFFHMAVDLDWRGDTHRHQALRHIDIGTKLGLPGVNTQSCVALKANEVEAAKGLLGNVLPAGTSFIVYHPGAGKIPNRYPAEQFARLANVLHERCKSQTVITLGPFDEEPVKLMVKHLDHPALVIERKPLRVVAAVLSMASLVVSNDTGIMHVAGGLGVPVLSLFGPTDPLQWAPTGLENEYVQGSGGDVAEISFDVLLRTAEKMLQNRNDSPSLK